MKKTFLTSLATGLFLVGSVSFSQALTLPGDYNHLFGAPPPTGYTVIEEGTSGLTAVYDVGSELIGYTGGNFSGIYIGTVTETPGQGGGNPITETDMEALISWFLGSTYNADVYLKVDGGAGSDSSGGVTLTVTSDMGGQTGTWLVSPNTYALEFYGVKAATEWALYFVDPAQTSGTWSTENLVNPGGNQPEISHFAGTATSNPIPEPTTMLLFGTGLIGLAGIARRKNA